MPNAQVHGRAQKAPCSGQESSQNGVPRVRMQTESVPVTTAQSLLVAQGKHSVSNALAQKLAPAAVTWQKHAPPPSSTPHPGPGWLVRQRSCLIVQRPWPVARRHFYFRHTPEQHLVSRLHALPSLRQRLAAVSRAAAGGGLPKLASGPTSAPPARPRHTRRRGCRLTRSRVHASNLWLCMACSLQPGIT
jgi:hypothetical protein